VFVVFRAFKRVVSTPPSYSPLDTLSVPAESADIHLKHRFYVPILPRPSRKSLVLAVLLFLLTLCTCLAAGAQFAAAFANNQAVSWEEFENAFSLFYKNPAGLLAGLPFAATLMIILLAHELGHFFACRHHHIRSTYPFFIPFPSLIGTFGAFILIRSPIRTTRALFDVGASGPFIGFLFAVPALLYGVANAKIVPGLNDLPQAGVVFGTPLALRLIAGIVHPGTAPGILLLHPVGRAAWVGLFATALNLLPSGQLDGGHILRSVSPRSHRLLSFALPVVLLALGYFLHWSGWFVWAGLLLALLFLRKAPFYDETPLDPARKLAALLALLIFLLCFMPAPILVSQTV
jgi:membrane-associated protease RseP (regulator of RpoE activity)